MLSPRAEGSIVPGIAFCSVIGIGAWLVERATIVPAVVAALLSGIGASWLATSWCMRPGASFCARAGLRFAVALLGVNLSFAHVAGLGWATILLALGAVAVTLTLGTWVGMAFGLTPERAILSAGAVGICGASAAMAIAAVLPRQPQREAETLFTVAAVTALSTAAMLLYPMIIASLSLGDLRAGAFFGSSIHDIAQVAGAGALLSPEAAAAATATKLVRVACLAPVAAAIAIWIRSRNREHRETSKAPLLPPFLIAFVATTVAANSGLLPRQLIALLGGVSYFALLAATAALGLQTSFHGLATGGWRPAAAVVSQTLLVGAFSLMGVWLLANQ